MKKNIFLYSQWKTFDGHKEYKNVKIKLVKDMQGQFTL